MYCYTFVLIFDDFFWAFNWQQCSVVPQIWFFSTMKSCLIEYNVLNAYTHFRSRWQYNWKCNKTLFLEWQTIKYFMIRMQMHMLTYAYAHVEERKVIMYTWVSRIRTSECHREMQTLTWLATCGPWTARGIWMWTSAIDNRVPVILVIQDHELEQLEFVMLVIISWLFFTVLMMIIC